MIGTAPRVYVSIAMLRRDEWSQETTCGVSADVLELVLRGCLKGERGDRIGAHVGLFFENPTPQMIALNVPHETLGDAPYRGNFWVDILVDGNHRVSYENDPGSWYRTWEDIAIKLYEVVGLNNEQIVTAQKASLAILEERRPYDPSVNLNGLCPWCCIPCGSPCWLGECCALCSTGRFVCGRGVTCVSAVMIALSVAKGGTESTAASTLGLPWRPVLGAFLPSELVAELVNAGVLRPESKPLALEEVKGVTRAVVPLLLLQF